LTFWKSAGGSFGGAGFGFPFSPVLAGWDHANDMKAKKTMAEINTSLSAFILRSFSEKSVRNYFSLRWRRWSLVALQGFRSTWK
jgi:hypothetical protein